MSDVIVMIIELLLSSGYIRDKTLSLTQK